MRWLGALILCGGAVFASAALGADEGATNGLAGAGRSPLPAGVTEQSFAPPPVPQFMLEKPPRPLSMDEMIRQVREAEQRAGAGAASPGPDHSGKSGAGQ